MPAAPSAIGRRVVVTGLAGSGKSTLSLALGAKTGLPVIHLDLHFWKPGWVAPSEAEWRETQRGVLAGDAWIADGNYAETLDLRLGRADTVVVLDLPWWRCSGRALRRGLRMPGELPPGCEYTRWQRLRDEWRLAVRIWRKDRTDPARERAIISQHGQHAAVHVLRSTRAVRDFLDAPRQTGHFLTGSEEHAVGMNLELQLVILPVTDIDRAKAFYVDLVGFNADHDHVVSDDLRFVQLTPPGSACSIAFGKGLTDATPGSVQGLQLVTDDIEATQAELRSRGLEVGEIDDQPFGRFVYFVDPDGNRWNVQQLPNYGG